MILTVFVITLTLTIMSYRSKHECINSVKVVNEVLTNKGMNTLCQKQQLKSAEECIPRGHQAQI